MFTTINFDIIILPLSLSLELISYCAPSHEELCTPLLSYEIQHCYVSEEEIWTWYTVRGKILAGQNIGKCANLNQFEGKILANESHV